MGRKFTDVQCHPKRLEEPLRWQKPRMVFVNSMSDLFHEDIPDEFIASVFAVMRDARRHTFQILTKRPDRACKLLNDPEFYECVDEISTTHETGTMFSIYKKMGQFVPPEPPSGNWTARFLVKCRENKTNAGNNCMCHG